MIFISAKNGKQPNAEVVTNYFGDFQSLKDILFSYLKNNDYDIVIHTAAVSDYSVKQVTINGEVVDNNTKIPSSNQEIEIKLIKNPKLINEIKTIAPNTKLIGFKLTNEDDVDLVEAAVRKQISEADCDLVVHNSLSQISGDKAKHSFNIFDKNSKKLSIISGVDALCAELISFILSTITKESGGK